MWAEFPCELCGRNVRVRAELAGRRVKCPGCAAVITVPAGEDAPAPTRSDVTPADRPAASPYLARDEGKGGRPLKDVQKPPGSSLPLVLGISGGVLVLLLAGLAVWWFYGKSSATAGDITALVPWVPGDAQGFISVRVAEVFKTKQVRQIIEEVKKQPGAPDPIVEGEKMLGLKFDEIERTTSVIQDARNNVVWSVIETSAPVDQTKFRAALKEASDTTIEGKKCLVGFLGQAPPPNVPPAFRDRSKIYAHFAGDRLLVLGTEPGIRKAITTAAKRPAGALDEGLALLSSGKHVVGAGIVPKEHVSGARQAMKGNPQMAKLLPLLEGQSGTATMHLGEKDLELEVSVKYAGDAQAQAARPAADEGIKVLKGMLAVARFGIPAEAGKALDAADQFVDSLQASQDGPKLVVKARADVGPETMASLLPLIGKMQGGGRADTSANNMRQIMLGLHAYHDAHGKLPADILDPRTRKPLLSWRVAILPYIDQGPLHKQFRLDEAWDSPHNRALLRQAPSTYVLPGAGPGSRTPYQLFTGPGTAFPNMMAVVTFRSITDGTSNTALLGEALNQVDWTRPGDIEVVAGQGPKLKLRQGGGRLLLGLADGSVRQISAAINDRTLRAALTPAGGEPLPPGWDR